MMHEENDGNKEVCPNCGRMHCNMGGWPMKKDFKLAMLEKKEKMIKAELDFISKMKEMINKMPEHKEE